MALAETLSLFAALKFAPQRPRVMDRSPTGLQCPYCGETPLRIHWVMCPACGKKLQLEEKHAADKTSPAAAPGPSGTSSAPPSREFELVRSCASRPRRPRSHMTQIDAQDVEWGEKLGEGSYGVVYCGKVRGTPVALKTVRSFEDALSQSGRRDERTVANLRNKINKQIDILKAEQAVVRQVSNPYICLYLVRWAVFVWCCHSRLSLRALLAMPTIIWCSCRS